MREDDEGLSAQSDTISPLSTELLQNFLTHKILGNQGGDEFREGVDSSRSRISPNEVLGVGRI